MRAFLIVGKKGQRLQWVLLFMISCPRPLHPQLWRFCAKMKIHRCPLQDNDFHYFHDLLNHHQGDDENWDNNVMTERSREGTAASVRAVMEERRRKPERPNTSLSSALSSSPSSLISSSTSSPPSTSAPHNFFLNHHQAVPENVLKLWTWVLSFASIDIIGNVLSYNCSWLNHR